MDSFTLSQLKEIYENLCNPAYVSFARGQLRMLIELADEECTHDLKPDMVYQSRTTGEDGELMNCCTKCDHSEPIVASDWVE